MKLKVTLTDLESTLTKITDGQIYLFNGDTAFMRLVCGKHHAIVSMKLCNQLDTDGSPQSICISFIFMDLEIEAEQTVSHLDEDVINSFCRTNQALISWSSLEIHDQEDGDHIVVLSRQIGTSHSDLCLAEVHDFSSQLTTAMFHMKYEFGKIAPLVDGLVSDNSDSKEQLQQLFNLPTSTQHS